MPAPEDAPPDLDADGNPIGIQRPPDLDAMGRVIGDAPPDLDAEGKPIFDPKVTTYPTDSLIDKTSTALESAMNVTDMMGSAFDTLRRPVASMVAGKGNVLDRAELAWKSRPALLGGNPELAPSGEDTKHALGIGDIPDKPGFDEQGNINWTNVLTRKLPNEAMNLLAAAATDPMIALHPGLSTEAASKQAALSSALHDMGAGLFKTREAAQAFARPKLGAMVAAGDVGVTARVPFTKIEGFMPVPKALAPLAKHLEPIFSMLDKPVRFFQGPDARMPEQIGQKRAEGIAKSIIKDDMRQRWAPIEEMATRTQMNPDDMVLAGQATAFFDPANAVRATEALPTVEGVPVQASLPSDLLPRFDKWEKQFPKEIGYAKEFYEQGPAHFKETQGKFFDAISSKPPEMRAAIWAMGQKLNEFAQGSVEMMKKHGVPLNELNAAEKMRPKLIFDALDAIEERARTTPARGVAEWNAKNKVKTTGRMMTPDEMVPGPGPTGFVPAFEPDPVAGAWVKPTEPRTFLGGPTSEIEPRLHEQSMHGTTPEWVSPETERWKMDEQSPSAVRTKGGEVAKLADAAIKGTLEHADMVKLVDELNKPGFVNHLDPAQLSALKKALIEQLPIAMKQFNAIPGYQPSVLSTAAREVYSKGKGNLDRAGKGGDVENAVRTLRLQDIDREFKDYGEVKASVQQQNEYYSKGTASTSGEVLKAPQKSFFRKYFVPKGLDDALVRAEELSKGRTQFLENPADAWHRQYGQYEKALTNHEMDMFIKGTYDMVPQELSRTIANTAYDGIDTGRKAPVTPGKFRDYIEGRESPIEYNNAKEAFERRQARIENGAEPVMREATLDDLEKIWKDSGRTDTLRENMAQSVLKDIESGKLPVKDGITSAWQPEGRDVYTLGNDTGYVHAGVIRDLENYKRLGTDVIGLGRWLEQKAPWYTWGVQTLKKLATIYSPTTAAYIMGNVSSDLVRAIVKDAMDVRVASDIMKGWQGHIKYADSGATTHLIPYDAGPMHGGVLSGPKAAELLERYNIIDAPGLVAEEFQPRGARHIGVKAIDAVKAPLTKAENVMRGLDNNSRSAVFFKYLREGKSLHEASLLTNEIFFDFTRKGPATAFLSQSGIVPFMGWHSKVVPFMADWIFKNPGEFAVMQRALKAMGDGDLDPDMIPEYLRDRTNITSKVTRNKKGEFEITFITDTGTLPGPDITSLIKSMRRDTIPGASWMLNRIGPVGRLLFAIHDQNKRNELDPNKTTWDEDLSRIGSATMGRPATVTGHMMDPKRSVADKAIELVNPMGSNTFNLTRQGVFSVKNAEHNLKSAASAVGRQQQALDEAVAEVTKGKKFLSQAEALEFAQNDSVVRTGQKELLAAQQRMARSRQELARIEKAYAAALKWANSMAKAP